ncbi:MAG: hypothetical protein J6W94_02640 [Bacteroidales bacterium]|nr:hypothetical protein [Bacteroidales bacterium]
MKKIFKYFGLILSVVLAGAVSSCDLLENEEQEAEVGLQIKVFSPEKVVAGVPMTINGSGFKDVTEIVFPDAVSVTDFKIVTDNMIRVNAPKGISTEGGKITVRTAAGEEAQSKADLKVGNTKVSGYSKQAGEEITGGELLTVYGEDLEFISDAEFIDADNNPLVIKDSGFYRKGTSTVVVIVPKNTLEGVYVGKLHTIDGKEFLLPELSYKKPATEGHWETVKKIIWEGDGSTPVAWNGVYRFGLDGTDANAECIATFPQEVWDKMKSETFYMDANIDNADWYNVRITTGWWDPNWNGGDLGKGNETILDNEDGTFTLTVDITGDEAFLEAIDSRHLLFTGEGYTPLRLYTLEEEWVGGEGHMEIVKTSVWKNDGAAAVAWNGVYRFGLEGTDGNNECIATIPQDIWDKMKSETFYVDATIDNADWYNVRITTGWWDPNWNGGDLGKGNELIVENEDGSFTLTVDITGDETFLEAIDSRHLLFTGEGYTPQEIYFREEVWVGGGGGPKEVVFWEGDGSAHVAWNGVYRFGLEGTDGNNECITTFPQDVWDKVKSGTFYMIAAIDNADWYNVRITTGWWDPNWSGGDLGKGNELIVENEDGTFTLTIDITGDDTFLEAIDSRHLLFTGEGYTPLKLYFLE